MKRILMVVLVVVLAIGLVGCGNKNKEKNTNNPVGIKQSNNIPEIEVLDNAQIYNSIMDDYNHALLEYDLDDSERDEKVNEKYSMVNPDLLMFVKMHENDGVTIRYDFLDIDKNGVDELLVFADMQVGAIYTYDRNTKQAVHLISLTSLERGDLAYYDNGIIISQGSGGAFNHVYEIGKIASDGVTYEVLEKLEEEYIPEGNISFYRNLENGLEMEYKSFDEVKSKYVK